MGSYANARGLRTYYETHGDGEPLLLLHGGLCTVESWGPQIEELSRHYRVFVPERRGHGRTPDVPGPVGYDMMTEDTVAFMAEVGLASAHVVGWSDGAAVGALMAMHHPELVRKLVLISQYYDADGQTAECRGAFSQPEALAAMFQPIYAAFSPDGPEHFPVVFDKMLAMWRSEPRLTMAELSKISAPTLVMQGDDDVVEVEHSAAVARAVPGAQLAVVPGTSHAAPTEKPAVVNRLILDFLADEQAPKFFTG